MIREECLIRRHFWVKPERLYSPLFELEERIAIDFEWKEDALFFGVEEGAFEQFCVSWPKYKEKDALLLFIDTLPSRKARSLERHCHEFLILPEAVEGVQTKEITRFHGYMTRPLMKDNALQVKVWADQRKAKRGYEVHIPFHQLFGGEEELEEVSFALSYFSKNFPRGLHCPIPTIIPEKIPYVWPIIHKEKERKVT